MKEHSRALYIDGWRDRNTYINQIAIIVPSKTHPQTCFTLTAFAK
jgi:hypothetical protein